MKGLATIRVGVAGFDVTAGPCNFSLNMPLLIDLP